MGIFPRIASLPRIHLVTAILLALLTALSGGAWAYLHPNVTMQTPSLTRAEAQPVPTAASPQSSQPSAARQASAANPHQQSLPANPSPGSASQPDHEQSLLQTSIDAITTRQNFLRSEIKNIHSEELYRAQSTGTASTGADAPTASAPSPRVQALTLEIQKLEAQKTLLSRRLEEAKPATSVTETTSPKADTLTADRSQNVAPAESLPAKSVPARSWQWTRVAVPLSLIVVLIAIATVLVGVFYLLAASRRFRTISSLAVFESVLPAEVLMLGSVAEIKA